MAHVYRPTYSRLTPDGTRKRRVSAKWYARWYDASRGKWRSKAGYRDKAATQALGDRLERDDARRAEGIAVPSDESRQPVAKLLADYVRTLRAKGRCPEHCANVDRELAALAAGCGWATAQHLDPDAVLRYLLDRRGATAVARFGLATSNHYLRSAKAFARWLVKRGVTAAARLAEVELLDEAGDVRRKRRALTEEELTRLIATTRAGPTWRGLSGPRRAALYVVAAYTGLRSAELGALAPDWIDFDGLTLTVPATAAKSGERAVLPLHPDAAAELRALDAPDGTYFGGSWSREHKAARMFVRRDLEAAGIAYRDATGRYADLHSLRVTFVTRLARAGVPLQTAQKLARHSTPVLTSNVYSQLDAGDLADALGRLPRAQPDARAGDKHGLRRRPKDNVKRAA